jgi:SpoVK/Ycf46/Vps4 family AAA+-type ATPase
LQINMSIFGKKPIMSPDLERQVLDAVTQYTKHKEWKKWGLHTIREAGAAILLKGPPGTGKTRIGEYLALRIRRKGIKAVSFADFGSHVPGENSRQIRKLFEDAKENGCMTVVIDECEALLWDRERAGNDAMWMLEVIDEMLIQISKYPGLIILMTNRPEMLDYALERRLLATIEVGRPGYNERYRLWKDKIPEPHPLTKLLTESQVAQLATLQLSGAEIETIVLNYSSTCIRNNIKPTFKGILDAAVEMEKTINEKTKKA